MFSSLQEPLHISNGCILNGTARTAFRASRPVVDLFSDYWGWHSLFPSLIANHARQQPLTSHGAATASGDSDQARRCHKAERVARAEKKLEAETPTEDWAGRMTQFTEMIACISHAGCTRLYLISSRSLVATGLLLYSGDKLTE